MGEKRRNEIVIKMKTINALKRVQAPKKNWLLKTQFQTVKN